jgi:hypothetical protein
MEASAFEIMNGVGKQFRIPGGETGNEGQPKGNKTVSRWQQSRIAGKSRLAGKRDGNGQRKRRRELTGRNTKPETGGHITLTFTKAQI